MEVWDPKDKNTVFSQIKSFIFNAERVLTRWVVRLHLGNLVYKLKDGLCEELYAMCEYYGSKVSNWAWHKRWNRRKR
jgi:hypothetical protein